MREWPLFRRVCVRARSGWISRNERVRAKNRRGGCFSRIVLARGVQEIVCEIIRESNKPEPSPESVSSSSDEVTPLKVHSNGIFEVITSRDVKAADAPVRARALDTRRHLGNVADVSIGYGGTTAWKMCAAGLGTRLWRCFLRSRKRSQTKLVEAGTVKTPTVSRNNIKARLSFSYSFTARQRYRAVKLD